jgi:hypothetical protein
MSFYVISLGVKSFDVQTLYVQSFYVLHFDIQVGESMIFLFKCFLYIPFYTTDNITQFLEFQSDIQG